MLARDMIDKIKAALSDNDDVEYTDKEILDYINYAILYLNRSLIALGRQEMAKDIVVTDNSNVPTDFEKFAGQFPIYISDNKFKLLTGTSVNIRYFANKLQMASLTSTIPFRDEYLPYILQFATILAASRNEFETAQDERLFSIITNLLTGDK